MPNIIEIPTYKTLIPNCVYGRKVQPLDSLTLGETHATQLIRLTKYTAPRKEEIIMLIKSMAEDITKLSLEDVVRLEDRNMEILLKLFSEEEIKRIAIGEESSIAHLKKHYPGTTTRENNTYIGTANGIIPNRILDSSKEFIEKEGEKAYDILINKAGASEWHLRVGLHKGSLPNKLEVDYLLDRGVRNCDIFKVYGDYENYKEVINQFGLIYTVFCSSEIISSVKDDSYNFMESLALSTLKGTGICEKSSEAIQNILKFFKGDKDSDIDALLNMGKKKSPSHTRGGHILN